MNKLFSPVYEYIGLNNLQINNEKSWSRFDNNVRPQYNVESAIRI